jgi:hypothetical protein
MLNGRSVADQMIQEFEYFLEQANAEILPIRSDLLAAVIDNYFVCAAPQ